MHFLHITGDFLTGFTLPGCPQFAWWLLDRQECYHRQALEVVQKLAGHYEQVQDYERVADYARKEVGLEPWSQSASRRLMRALALSGQRHAALAYYNHSSELLFEEMGSRPSVRTTRLYEAIRAGRLKPGDTITGCETDPKRSNNLSPSNPFVGFEKELAWMNHHLEEMVHGQGRVLFVTGEAGSGKSTLLGEFSRRALHAQPELLIIAGSCDTHTGPGIPYLPLRNALRLLVGQIETGRFGQILGEKNSRRLQAALSVVLSILIKLGPDLFSTFLPSETINRLARDVSELDPELKSQLESLCSSHAAWGSAKPELPMAHLFSQVRRVFSALSDHHPLLLVLDDLQWADRGTINLLYHLGRRLPGKRILLVGAYRPEMITSGPPAHLSGLMERHPLQPVIYELQQQFGDNRLNLDKADGRSFVQALLDCEPNLLDGQFRQTLYQHTQGNPLFTVELLRALQRRWQLFLDEQSHWVSSPAIDWGSLPPRVEAVIGERLGRLPHGIRAMLEAASVQGQTFVAEVVGQVQAGVGHRVFGLMSEVADRQHRLVQAQGVERLGDQQLSRYRFYHFMFQQYLYERLDGVQKLRLHEATGRALEALYGDEAHDHASQLARHFEVAGVWAKAVEYLLAAGKRAYLLSANEEAIVFFRRGLQLLVAQPPSMERDRSELVLQLALGAPLRAVYGQASDEVGHSSHQALDLAQKLGTSDYLFPARFLCWGYYLARAQYEPALTSGLYLLDQSESEGHLLHLAQAKLAMGTVQLCLGNLHETRIHIEAILGEHANHSLDLLVSPFIESEIRLGALIPMAWTDWFLGYPAQALERSEQALTLTRRLNHPYSLAMVLAMSSCVIHWLRQEYHRLEAMAGELLECATDNGFSLFTAWGLLFQGRAWIELGKKMAGLKALEQGLAAFLATGQRWNLTLVLGLMAEAQLESDLGQKHLAEALDMVEETGEKFFAAELYRLQGKLILRNMSGMGADCRQHEVLLRDVTICFRRALKIARNQEAKSLELRAATSMARLWHGQGRTQEAHQLLAEICGWFKEGFETADLQAAATLLHKMETETDIYLPKSVSP